MNRIQPVSPTHFFEDMTQGKILKERIREPLYSRKQFAVDKNQTVNFFRNHAGGSKLDTNLVVNGSMPSTQRFALEGFSFRLEFGMDETDIIKFYNHAVLLFSTQDKRYLCMPLSQIPSGCGLTGPAALDGAASAVKFIEITNGIPSPTSYYPVVRRGPKNALVTIPLAPQQLFEVDIQTFAPSDFSATFNGTVFMHGERNRESA